MSECVTANPHLKGLALGKPLIFSTSRFFSLYVNNSHYCSICSALDLRSMGQNPL